MLSKNNFREVTKHDAQRTPHYGLRKLSVGVASVLLSTTLYAGLNAQADTVTSDVNDADISSQAVSVDSLTGSTTPTDPAAPASITALKSTVSPNADQDGVDPSSASTLIDGSKTTPPSTNVTANTLIASKVAKPLVLMAQSGATPAAATDPTASVAQGIKDTGVGGTFSKVPQYVVKSSSIEFGGINFTKINNYSVNLSRESSFEFSVKGKFTLDGNQIKKDRQILLGTILFTNNFYTDPNNAAHNQHMLISWGGPITVISSNGKEIGYAQLSNANGAEADWMLHVTSTETWVGDFNISLNIPLAGYVGYFTDTAVYKNVTTDKPWVETVQTPDNTYKLTYTLHTFTSGWRYYQNSVGRDKGSIYFTKIAPALQTNEKYPSATLQDTLGKVGPADAKLGNYKFVVKVSGLGTPTSVNPGVGFESSFYPVDQNNHVIAEMIGYYGNVNGTSTKLANNLTAQQLYDQVGAHQTLYSVQDDGSMLIATEITPADIYLSDERIIQELQHGSMLYATSSLENQQKIIKNTLAFYHGVLKNTPLITRTYFRTNDGNGFRNAIIDSDVQDVTPLSSGRAPVPDTRYYKVGAPSASASGDLLQHNYVYYIDGSEGNKVIRTTDLAGKAGDTKTITVTIPTGYLLDQVRTGSTPASYVLKDGDNTPIYIYLKHTTVQVTPDQPKTTGDKLPDNPTKSYPTGVGHSDLNKTVTRTIQVVDPHTQQVATTAQPVHLTRTAEVDEVDGTVTYGEWTTGKWPTFNVPGVAGYTPSQASINQATVTDMTKDQTIKITYIANAQTTQVNYVDQSGKVVHSTLIKGATDQTVTVPNEVPANWQLVSGQTVPSQLTFGPDGHPAVTVKIEHQTTTTREQKTITRTINYVAANGTPLKPATVQRLSFTRTGVQDLVTKAITWNSTPNQSFVAVNDLDILGYKPDTTTVPAVTVNWDTQNSIVDVHYQVAKSTVTVNLVDTQGHVIATTPVTGQVGSTVALPVSIPDGWVVYNADLPARVVMGSSSVKLDYLIGHRLVLVKASDNVKAGDLIPGTKTKTFNDQVNVNNLITHAAYTVNVWADEEHTQKLTTKTYHTDFNRDALVDAVTGDVYYYNWSEGGKHTFAGFTRQAGDGYQAVVAPAWMATQANPTKTLDLVARPQQAAGTIRYQTMDGSVVFSQDFAGNKAVTLTAPKGYTLMTNVAAITPALGQGQIYTVYVRPAETLYTAADQRPAGVESLRKTVTRTIHITEANGHVRTITQRVRFTRTATVKADGSIVYSAWRATGRAVWNKVFLPKRHGYHLVIDGGIDKMNVTGDMRDVMVNVKYVKD